MGMIPTMSGRARPWVAGVLAGVVVGAFAMAAAVLRPAVVERGELWTYDLRLRESAEGRRGATDIVLITVSEQDITDVENHLLVSWPWPRELFGYLATYAKGAGARAIVFDWLFQDRGLSSVADAETFAAALREAQNAVIGLSLTREPVVRLAEGGPWALPVATFGDREQAQARALALQAWNARTFLLPRQGQVELWIGGTPSAEEATALWARLAQTELAKDLLSPPEPPSSADAPTPDPADAPADALGATPAPRPLTEAELGAELRVADLLLARHGVDGSGVVPQRDGIDPPLGIIAAAPRQVGHVHQDNDLDGVIRRHTPLVRHAGKLFPSLPLAAYLVAHPQARFALEGRSLTLDGRRFPLDDEGRFAVRYVTSGGYRTVSAYEIFRSQALLEEGKPPSVPASALAGAYVLVAPVAHGLRDLRVTPMSDKQLGAEINANVLDNLEQGAVIRRASALADGLVALALALVTALLMTALSRTSRRPLVALPLMVIAAAATIAGFVALAAWLLAAHDLWIATAVPASAGTAAAFVTLVSLSVAERQSRRFVQEALGRYTSPALVRELIAHPEHLSLDWGQEREMSVYFSDIAGFTTISEQLSARQLVSLLNEYLTEMTDLVLAHGGIVDKYIGDAVMAFWGAPLDAPDHAERAVSCAIAMRNRCDELRATWKERYGHEVYARAGINSGVAVVGNMGSRHKYNYTVMGDIVNLASRLEGANKPYGTFLMISEATLRKLGGAVLARELDLLAVKGKTQPVKVYEVIDFTARATAADRERVARFEAALARYRDRDFAHAKAELEALVKDTGDEPSKLYVERCEIFLAEPPPADWNGVWTMKEK